MPSRKPPEKQPSDESREERPDIVEVAGEESFPASDPPSWTPLHAGHHDGTVGRSNADDKDKSRG